MDKKILEAFSKLVPKIITFPGDEAYEKASQFFKRTLAPSVVVRPASSEDMATVMRFINEHELPLSLKAVAIATSYTTSPTGSYSGYSYHGLAQN
jgi:FAD/FMN-containing dehydrogenase